jgi:Spy/CpxP family protein refolding chaperone
MRIVRTLLTLAIVLSLASALSAAEKKRGEGRRPGGGGPGLSDVYIKAVESLNLTDEQKEKVAEIKKEAAEHAKKRDALLTQEQKDARNKAMEEAKTAGKTPREIFQAGRDAVKMTDEQKTKSEELAKEGQKIFQKLRDLLTEEQRAALREKMPRRGERKPESK